MKSDLSMDERAALSRVLGHLEDGSPVAPDLPSVPLAAAQGRRRSAVLVVAGAFVLAIALVAPTAWLLRGPSGIGSEPSGGSITTVQAEVPPPVETPTTVLDSVSPDEVTTTTAVGPVTTGGVAPEVIGAGIDPMILSLLPQHFDPLNAVPLFTVDGDAMDVAVGYVESRFPDSEALGVGIAYVEEIDGFVLARWAWGLELNPEAKQVEQGRGGWLLLRPSEVGFEVVASTTNSVDLADVTYGGELGGVSGTITGPGGLGVDVLTLEGNPVPSAPYPDGFIPKAAYLWGTSGASDFSPLSFDVAPVSGPVIVRVNMVGGTLLSISEFVLQPPDGTTTDTAPDLSSLMPRVVVDIPGFEIVAGSESRDGSHFHGEWQIRIGDVSGHIILDSDTSTSSRTFDDYEDVRVVGVADSPGLLGIGDQGLDIEWELDDRITIQIEGTALDAHAVVEAIRYVDEATWRRLLPDQ
ncbi:MAG: hypothetical protein GY926_11505 [bacterium]|nr:hypothetical protein [bacterium]